MSQFYESSPTALSASISHAPSSEPGVLLLPPTYQASGSSVDPSRNDDADDDHDEADELDGEPNDDSNSGNVADMHPSVGCTRAFFSYVLRQQLPLLTWKRDYHMRAFANDVLAGAVTTVIFIPQAISCSGLLQVPLQTGMYSAAISSLIYAVMGASMAVSPGPANEIALVLLQVDTGSADPYVRLAYYQLMAVQAGLFLLLLSFINGGVIIRNSFSATVADAFTCAAGIMLVLTQVTTVLNIPGQTTVIIYTAIQTIVQSAIAHASINSVYCALIFSGYLFYLVGVKQVPRLPKWLPHPLFMIIASTLITYFLDLRGRFGLIVIGTVPDSIVDGSVPDLSWGTFVSTAPTSILTALVMYLQQFTIGTRYEVESMPLNPNVEIRAAGAMSLVTGLTQGYCGSAAFSRAAVIHSFDGKTPLLSLVVGVLMFVSALVLTKFSVLYYTPKHALAAILVASGVALVNFTKPRNLWQIRAWQDLLVWVSTWLCVLLLGTAIGIFVGIVVSIILLLLNSAQPETKELGFDTETQDFRPLDADPDLTVVPGVFVWSFGAPLNFVNVHHLRSSIQRSLHARTLVDQREGRIPVHSIVIDASKVTEADSTALDVLEQQIGSLVEHTGLNIVFSNAPPQVSAALARFDLPPTQFPSVTAAVSHAVSRQAVGGQSNQANKRGGRSSDGGDSENESLVTITTSSVAQRNQNQRQHLAHNRATTFDIRTMDLRGFHCVLSHADRTPKQKVRLDVKSYVGLAKLRSVHLDLTYNQSGDTIAPFPAAQQQGASSTFEWKLAASHAIVARHFTRDFVAALIEEQNARMNMSSMSASVVMSASTGTAPESMDARLDVDELVALMDATDPRKAVIVGRVFGSGHHLAGEITIKWGGDITVTGRQQAESVARSLTHRIATAIDHARRTAQESSRSHPMPKCMVETHSSSEDRVCMTAKIVSQFIDERTDDNGVKFSLKWSQPKIDDEKLDRVSPETRTVETRHRDRAATILACRDEAAVDMFGHLVGMRALLTSSGATSPAVAVEALVHELHNFVTQLIPVNKGDASFEFYEHEPVALFKQRYAERLKRLKLNPADPKNITTLFDYIEFDVIHNANAILQACGYDMAVLFAVARDANAFARSLMRGVNDSEKFIMSAVETVGFIEELINFAEFAASMDESTSATRVPCRLFFSPSALLDGLRDILHYSPTLRDQISDAARRVLGLSEECGYRYLSHLFVKVWVPKEPERRLKENTVFQFYYSGGATSLLAESARAAPKTNAWAKLKRLRFAERAVLSLSAAAKSRRDGAAASTSATATTVAAAPAPLLISVVGREEDDKESNAPGSSNGPASPRSDRASDGRGDRDDAQVVSQPQLVLRSNSSGTFSPSFLSRVASLGRLAKQQKASAPNSTSAPATTTDANQGTTAVSGSTETLAAAGVPLVDEGSLVIDDVDLDQSLSSSRNNGSFSSNPAASSRSNPLASPRARGTSFRGVMGAMAQASSPSSKAGSRIHGAEDVSPLIRLVSLPTSELLILHAEIKLVVGRLQGA